MFSWSQQAHTEGGQKNIKRVIKGDRVGAREEEREREREREKEKE